MKSSGGLPSCCTQSLTLSLPASLCGLSTMSPAIVSCWTVLLGLPVIEIVDVETSNGISLTIGQLVLPCAVLIFATCTSPSLPVINSLTIANFHVFLGLSSCTRTMSPGFTSWLLFSVVLPKRGQVFISPTCSKLIQQEGLQLGSLGCTCYTTIGRVTQVLFVHYGVGQ